MSRISKSAPRAVRPRSSASAPAATKPRSGARSMPTKKPVQTATVRHARQRAAGAETQARGQLERRLATAEGGPLTSREGRSLSTREGLPLTPSGPGVASRLDAGAPPRPSADDAAIAEAERAAADIAQHRPGTRAHREATAVAAEAANAAVQAAPPRERAAVADQLGDELETIGAALAQNPGGPNPETERAAVALTQATETLGPDHASAITGPVAGGLSTVAADANPQALAVGVQQAVGDGHGALFGASLSQQLSSRIQSDGTPADLGVQRFAHATALGTSEGIDTLRGRYDDAQDALDHELDVQGAFAAYGGALPPDEFAAGTAAAQARVDDVAGAANTAAEQLATALDGAAFVLGPNRGFTPPPNDGAAALVDQSAQALGDVARFGTSPGGQQVIADALASRGQGEATWLDALPAAAAQSDDPERARVALGAALTDSATADGIVQAGQPGGAQAVADTSIGLAASLQGLDLIDADHVGRIRNAYNDFAQSPDDENAAREVASAVNSARSHIDRVIDGFNDARGTELPHIGDRFAGGTRLVAGLTFANAAFGAADAILHGSGEERVRAIIGTGADAISATNAALTAFAGNAERFASITGPLTVTGRVLGVVNAGFSAADAARHFAEQRYLAGAGSGLTAAGALLSAAASANVVPGWGQAVAAGLSVAGIVTSAVAATNETNRFEGPLEDILREAGVPPEVARQLNNNAGAVPPGAVLSQLAADLGLSPTAFYNQIAALPEKDPRDRRSVFALDELVELSHDVINGDLSPARLADIARAHGLG